MKSKWIKQLLTFRNLFGYRRKAVKPANYYDIATCFGSIPLSLSEPIVAQGSSLWYFWNYVVSKSHDGSYGVLSQLASAILPLFPTAAKCTSKDVCDWFYGSFSNSNNYDRCQGYAYGSHRTCLSPYYETKPARFTWLVRFGEYLISLFRGEKASFATCVAPCKSNPWAHWCYRRMCPIVLTAFHGKYDPSLGFEGYIAKMTHELHFQKEKEMLDKALNEQRLSLIEFLKRQEISQEGAHSSSIDYPVIAWKHTDSVSVSCVSVDFTSFVKERLMEAQFKSSDVFGLNKKNNWPILLHPVSHQRSSPVTSDITGVVCVNVSSPELPYWAKNVDSRMTKVNMLLSVAVSKKSAQYHFLEKLFAVPGASLNGTKKARRSGTSPRSTGISVFELGLGSLSLVSKPETNVSAHEIPKAPKISSDIEDRVKMSVDWLFERARLRDEFRKNSGFIVAQEDDDEEAMRYEESAISDSNSLLFRRSPAEYRIFKTSGLRKYECTGVGRRQRCKRV